MSDTTATGHPAAPGIASEIHQTDVAGVTAEEAVDRLVARAVAMGASDLFLNANEAQRRCRGQASGHGPADRHAHA